MNNNRNNNNNKNDDHSNVKTHTEDATLMSVEQLTFVGTFYTSFFFWYQH